MLKGEIRLLEAEGLFMGGEECERWIRKRLNNAHVVLLTRGGSL